MTETQEKPKLTVVRWIFVVLGCLIMVFCGGCMLIFVEHLIGTQNGWVVLFMFGGIPFLVGLLILFLAVKVGR